VSASEVLVIILSVFLALFLVLAIVLTVLLIKVTQQIKSVTATAQSAAEKLNSFAGSMTKVASPALLAKMAFDQLKKMKK
jgi:predicted PurR-regulated permease PerM